MTPPRRKARGTTVDVKVCFELSVCWFCIFAADGSVKIISGLEARKYRERYTMVILNTHQHTSEVNIIENIHLHI